MDNLMSQADYARHRGVSKQAVGKMIRAGKIPTTDRGGRKMIDAAAADFALGENRARINVEQDDAAEASRSVESGRSSGSSGLTKAKTESETYRAKIAELEYNERVGKLLPIDDVTRAMERCAELLVREIDQLPTHADDLATSFSKGGVAGLRHELKERARILRETLSNHMRLTAASDEEEEDR